MSAYFDLLKDFEEVEALLKANNVPTKPTFVVWPGRSSLDEFTEHSIVPTQFSPFGFTADATPGSLEAVRHRRAGVQDEGSQLVAYLFAQAAAQSKSWLDICAGPGGKAALLSSLAYQSNHPFTANELSQVRADLVSQVVGDSQVWVGDAREIAERNQSFDAILADVPCTGLGALRRRPEVRWRRSVTDLRELTALQRELSDSAVSILNENGIFAYATCSPHFAETTVAVADILKAHPNLEQIDLAEYLPAGLDGALRGRSLSLWTHRHETDAMFMAVFRKKGA